MKKQFLFLTLMTFAVSSLTAFDARKMFDEKTRWEFLEKTFVVDAHGEKQVIWNHIYSCIPAACAMVAGYKYYDLSYGVKAEAEVKHKNTQIKMTYNNDDSVDKKEITTELSKKDEKDVIKDLLSDENIYFFGGAIAATICGSQLLQCYLNYSINRQVVAEFLKDWARNKSLTPVEFHHVFDALVDIMDVNGDEAVLVHATEIVDSVQFMVMRHFEKRYEKVLSIQAVNNLSDTKTILDLIKGSLEIGKGFGA